MLKRLLLLLLYIHLIFTGQVSVSQIDSTLDDGIKELESAFNNPGNNFPQKPNNYVTDETGILSASEAEALNNKLRDFEQKTTTQLALYICRSLNNEDMDQLCLSIFNTWGLGQKDKNNGLLIAVFVNDHKYRIQVGSGLESIFPNNFLKKIQDDHMRAHFKDNDFYAGLDAGTDQLIYYASHPYEGEWEFWGMDKTTWVYIYIINASLLLILLIALWRVPDKTGEEGKQALKGIGAALLPFLGALILIVMFLMVMSDFFPGEEYVSYNTNSWWWRRRYYYGDDENEESFSSSSSPSSGFTGGGGASSGGGSSSDW